jgi:plasmid maintenance system antidote protein VapI
MSGTDETSMSGVLRAAIVASGVPYKTLERETGVTRASIMRFVRGSQSLRLDMADKLAAYFRLTLTAKRKRG